MVKIYICLMDSGIENIFLYYSVYSKKVYSYMMYPLYIRIYSGIALLTTSPISHFLDKTRVANKQTPLYFQYPNP